MSMNPKISVIIPTYNRAWALQRSLDSVLAQTFEDFELLIVDDGSTDGTQELLQTFDDSRICVITTQNQGVSCARNTAIERVRGEWIAFLDSDDQWLPHKLALQWERLQQHPQLQVIHGEEIWFRRGVRVNPRRRHAKSGGWIFAQCLPLCLISPSAVMIHRKVFERVGCFDPQMTVCEDYDLWLRITPFYEVGFITDPIINKYGGHSDQLSGRYPAMDAFRVKAIQKILQCDIGGYYRELAQKTLQEKARILLQGYRKRKNWAYYEELQAVVKEVGRDCL